MSGIQHTQTIHSRVGELRIYEDKTGDAKALGWPVEICKTADLVQRVAYKLWEDAGRPEGLSDHFWYEAEKALDKEGFDIKLERLMGKGFFYAPYVSLNQPLDLAINPNEPLVTRYATKIRNKQRNGDYII